MKKSCKKVTIQIDNKYLIALTKNHVFHGRNKNILEGFTSLENEQVEVEHVSENEQRVDILTKTFA